MAGLGGIGAPALAGEVRYIADAAICHLARDGNTVLTGDSRDIEHLLRSRGTPARVYAV